MNMKGMTRFRVGTEAGTNYLLDAAKNTMAIDLGIMGKLTADDVRAANLTAKEDEEQLMLVREFRKAVEKQAQLTAEVEKERGLAANEIRKQLEKVNGEVIKLATATMKHREVTATQQHELGERAGLIQVEGDLARQSISHRIRGNIDNVKGLHEFRLGEFDRTNLANLETQKTQITKAAEQSRAMADYRAKVQSYIRGMPNATLPLKPGEQQPVSFPRVLKRQLMQR